MNNTNYNFQAPFLEIGSKLISSRQCPLGNTALVQAHNNEKGEEDTGKGELEQGEKHEDEKEEKEDGVVKPELSKRDKRRAREAAKKAREVEAAANASTQNVRTVPFIPIPFLLSPFPSPSLPGYLNLGKHLADFFFSFRLPGLTDPFPFSIYGSFSYLHKQTSNIKHRLEKKMN